MVTHTHSERIGTGIGTQTWLHAIHATIDSYRRMVDAAVGQLTDEEIHRRLRPGSHSVAVLLRHLGGNLRSRWTDFLETDGEKPTRDRDREFEDWTGTRAELWDWFDEGWQHLTRTLDALGDVDPARTVTIRGEPHTVAAAVARSITHVSYHVGQLLLVARLVHGDDDWTWLTIAPGGSAAHNAATWGTASSRSVGGGAVPASAPPPTAAACTLRPVRESDLPTFRAHQFEPGAAHMAAFTSAEPLGETAFHERWRRLMSDDRILARTIEVDGTVSGHVMCYDNDGAREVTYWIGRAFWGRGIATSALRQFLQICTERPLRGRAAADNTASLRVLEKCGFRRIGTARGLAPARGAEIDEVVMQLDA